MESNNRTGNVGAKVSIGIFGVGELKQVRVIASPISRNLGGGVTASTSQDPPNALLRTRVTESQTNPGADAIIVDDRGEVVETTAARASVNAKQKAAASERYDFQQLARWLLKFNFHNMLQVSLTHHHPLSQT